MFDDYRLALKIKLETTPAPWDNSIEIALPRVNSKFVFVSSVFGDVKDNTGLKVEIIKISLFLEGLSTYRGKSYKSKRHSSYTGQSKKYFYCWRKGVNIMINEL